ncbi:hypothetical protein BTVI_116621 [Pitangus sulphuratus]|nr:hypothetical protein BTVI_116621 [Pitangus sulphuratus]
MAIQEKLQESKAEYQDSSLYLRQRQSFMWIADLTYKLCVSPENCQDIFLAQKNPLKKWNKCVEKMGNAESNAYHNHLSRFLPEEQTDIDGVFDTLSGSSGSAGGKNAKATKKTLTLAALQARQSIIHDISGM